MTQNVLQRVPLGSRVAVIRLRSLGDCVLTTPALALLRQARPDLNLAIVVEDRFAPSFHRNPDLDKILPATVSAVAQWKPDLVINLHGGSTSSQMTFASRARWRAGFEHFRFRALYNVRIPKAQRVLGVERKVHTAEHLASAMFFIGVPMQEVPRAKLYAESGPPRSRRPYAVLHPKASEPAKTWPAAHFVTLASRIQKELGLEPVFIAGPGETLAEFDPYECLEGADLERIKSLLSGASLFVGNDSGPAHMAAAFGVRVVALFGSSDPAIWGPWRTECEVLTSAEGIAAIPVEQALDACARLHAGQAR